MDVDEAAPNCFRGTGRDDGGCCWEVPVSVETSKCVVVACWR